MALETGHLQWHQQKATDTSRMWIIQLSRDRKEE